MYRLTIKWASAIITTMQQGATVKVTAKPVKLLNPRSGDTQVMGTEPTWEVQPTDNRISRMSKAFGWYNYFYGKKDARDMIVNYLETHGRKNDVKLLRGVSDSAIRLTTGWLCRMSMVGLELTAQEHSKLELLLKEILASKQEAQEETAEPEVPRVTIQDRLREKVSECAGELDGLFDEFVTSGAKMSADYKPIMTIRGMNVAPQMISVLSGIWQKKQAEFEAAIAGKDPQLVEAYSYLTKVQLRNALKFCETVINDCGAYVQIKKVERKPRKAREVPPEKKAAKFKHITEFAELKLKGLPAASLVDKSEAWLYDTKKRKLIHVVADEYAKVFTVKNNSVIGFSTVETQQKTVRKPAEVLKALGAAGKPAARKIYKDLTTTETPFNGRGTENLIVLKSW
jgi:hypothetical protein